MREFKFRCWNRVLKKMIDDLAIYDGEPATVEYHDIGMAGGGLLLSERISHSIIMQYTGLKDSENNEIYEGDILEFSGYGDEEIFAIEWSIFEGCGCCNMTQGQGFDFGEYDPGKCKIIGNIYENPELLEAKDE